ncbi:hypothetical protein [Metallosphaera hakonensis]|uniref:HEAT repeat domain-containing protein n=1 Tax=Metallosphaera hakonensis JCM 8857 = DSM 7519 TaxID=1293036 RepID=A0A2U9IWH4_9CREN|nr:hypothetical protein [Metallosphaera hakonensis]AWS00387.1 hypothetical protein DFR87_12675 [Metallosphaera hakonensis JCM 8857 = DSM 7519]
MELSVDQIMEKLRSGKVSKEELWNYLQSSNKDVKHEAWVTAQKMIERKHSLLLDFLCFPDHGTRYRAWNLFQDFMNEFDREVINSRTGCLLEMLRDEDLNVRRLTWYVTLPRVLQYLDVNIVKQLVRYCEEVAVDEWKELIEDTCRELGLMR